MLRFPAFDTCATPEIDGEVTRVSADVTHDPKTGQSYDTARNRIREDRKECLKGLRLVLDMRGGILDPDRRVLPFFPISRALCPIRSQTGRLDAPSLRQPDCHGPSICIGRGRHTGGRSRSADYFS
jgi:hypothetical protein